MTDPRTDSPEGPRHNRKIPPLVWIVVALLVVWAIVAVVQRKNGHSVQAEGASVMPAAPASGDAPATPASTVNGPAQPAPVKP